MMILKNFIFSA